MILSELDRELVKKLAEIKIDKLFIGSVYNSLETDEDKTKMLEFLKQCKEDNRKISMSDVYVKELEITKGIKLDT